MSGSPETLVNLVVFLGNKNKAPLRSDISKSPLAKGSIAQGITTPSAAVTALTLSDKVSSCL